MRISDWSSDVCSSDLARRQPADRVDLERHRQAARRLGPGCRCAGEQPRLPAEPHHLRTAAAARGRAPLLQLRRSEEHTSELQSLMRISYAVFCLKKKKKTQKTQHTTNTGTLQQVM